MHITCFSSNWWISGPISTFWCNLEVIAWTGGKFGASKASHGLKIAISQIFRSRTGLLKTWGPVPPTSETGISRQGPVSTIHVDRSLQDRSWGKGLRTGLLKYWGPVPSHQKFEQKKRTGLLKTWGPVSLEQRLEKYGKDRSPRIRWTGLFRTEAQGNSRGPVSSKLEDRSTSKKFASLISRGPVFAKLEDRSPRPKSQIMQIFIIFMRGNVWKGLLMTF